MPIGEKDDIVKSGIGCVPRSGVDCVLNRLQIPRRSSEKYAYSPKSAINDNEEKEFKSEKEKQPVSQKDSGRESENKQLNLSCLGRKYKEGQLMMVKSSIF